MISFYSPKEQPYGPFSNFSRHEVFVFNRTWATSEHPFQALKFSPHRPDLVAKVGHAPTPGTAARLGRDRSFPLRDDWDLSPSASMWKRVTGDIPNPDDGIDRQGLVPEATVHRTKDLIMYEVVYAKFTQHQDLTDLLLGTGDQSIVEAAEHDPYWGWGPSRNGLNKLGRILMAVRTVLQTGNIEGVPFRS